MVPMRDGIRLATDIYFPARNGVPAEGTFPTLMERTPYNKEGIQGTTPRPNTAEYFVTRDYVMVFQDTRGRYKSEGSFTKYLNEGQDGKTRRVAVSIGPQYGTVGPDLVKEAAKEAIKGVGFDLLIVCGFAFDPRVSEETKRYGNLSVLVTRMNPDLSMGDELLKSTGAGNLFMVFGEPDVVINKQKDGKFTLEIKGEEMAGMDAEACAYLYAAALTNPMDHDWTQIYLYIATQTYRKWGKNEMPGDIAVDSINDDQMRDLNRLKAWLYHKRTTVRLDRERAERRQKKDEEEERRKAEQPALFDF